MKKIRLLIADDQLLFARSLKKVLEKSAPDFDVAGLSFNGEKAVAFADTLKPDVILMDVRMPVLDGVQAAKQIHETYPDIHIMMLTTFNDDTYVKEALQYGATAYLLKDLSPEELIASIRAIPNVSIIISPRVAGRFISYENVGVIGQDSSSHNGRPAAHMMQRIKELSRREKDVFDLVLKGFDNQSIGEQLFLAEQTVRNSISHIYTKLEVENRLELIRQLKH